MKRYFCTYFDRNYLLKALSLIESLVRHGGDFHLFAVCHDEISRLVIQKLGGDRVTALPIHEFERGDSRLVAAKHQRTPVEYYWTATPTIILRLLERHPEIPLLAYVDADLFFYSSPEPIFDEVGDRSVLIHEHRFSVRHKHLEADNGKYNVGMLCFKNDDRAREVLVWWRDRCIEWCYRKVENGKMGDQFYLNDWPERFQGVGVLQHPGAGVAPWNIDGYRVGQTDSGAVSIDGAPLLFFHFHALSIVSSEVIVPAIHKHYLLTEDVLSACYSPYAASLARGIFAARSVVPGFSGGLDGIVPELPENVLMLKSGLPEGARERGFSKAMIEIGNGWRCTVSPQLVSIAEPLAVAAKLSAVNRPEEAREVVSQLLGRYPDLPTAENLLGEIQLSCGDPDGAERTLEEVVAECPRYVTALSNLAAVCWGNGKHEKAGAFIAKGLAVDPFDRSLVINAAEICTGLGRDEDAQTLYLNYLGRVPSDAEMSARLEALVGKCPPEAMLPTAASECFMPQFTTGNDTALLETLLPVAGNVRVVYFIGAHLFQEEDWMLRTFPNLEKLYLFEPLPDAYAYLAKKYAGHPVISVFDCAISDTDGTAEFNVADNGQSSSLLDFGVHKDLFPDVRMVNKTTVKVRRISSLVLEHSLSSPDLLFIDAQGAEYKILSSIDAPFLEKIPIIYSEVSTAEVYKGGRTLLDVRILLEKSFHFVGFAPLHPHVPQHGNALFVNRSILGKPIRRPAGETIAPLVTVLVSAYNSEAFISECLDDLQNQTMAAETEIIVVDAASPQQEGKIVLERQAENPNILYVRTPVRIGVYAAWNLALKLARGKYVTVFSTNDRLRKDAHEILARTLDTHPEVALVYGDSYITNTPHETFDRHTRVSTFEWPEYSFDDLLNNCMVGPNPMWRRSVHDAIGVFDEHYTALGDQDFFIRVGEQFPLLHIPVFTGLYWYSSDGLSNRPELTSPEDAEIRTRYRERHKSRKGDAGSNGPATGVFEVTIVIPVLNNLHLTRKCIESIGANSGDSIPYELIVVDNGSTDGTAEFLRQLSGDVRIISNRENLGFAKASNQGGRAAKGEVIVFLNNDTVVQPGWLVGLVHAGAEICGAKLLYPDGTVQHAGVVFDPLGQPYHLFRGFPADSPAVNKAREFNCVTAACMAVQKRLFDTLGGFDEEFRNGFEDVDFCLRAKETGARILYTPESVVTHFESRTPGRKAHEAENAGRFHDRWRGRIPADDESIYAAEGFITIPIDGGRFYLLDINQPAFEAVERLDLSCFGIKGLGDGEVEKIRRKIHAIAGKKLVARKAYPVATEHFRRALELGEESVLTELGDCLAREGKGEEAALCYSRAIENDPAAAKAWVGLGVLRLMAADPGAASGLFAKAVAIEPADGSALCGMGLAAAASGNGAEGCGWFSRALDADPSNMTAIHELIKGSFEQGQFDEAESRIRKVLEFLPSNAHMLFSLAGICHKQGKRADALVSLDRLALFSPDYEGADALRAVITT